ncbi:DUF3822 family protein [Hymenobacter sp. RP-2-7]|uniref:DUF3822 family protein n=1 Tax=Hymenobacter polaris TaxID=2682546 RepID=A0A7Y0AC55_9BACT|nr:DUF3822 family protein [Hymenobacter polaris]NML64608.1 DUF3822 family protein [Hymenobacter polaris]
MTAPAPPLLAAPIPELVRLRDEAFDLANPTAYHLYALAAPGRLRVAVLDAARHKVVALDDQPLSHPADLPVLAATHELLGRPGWARVRLGLGTRAFTLLPAPLFRLGDEAAYLAPHHTLGPTEVALACPLPQAAPATDVVALFAADAGLAQWLHDTFGPAARLLPQPAALLAGWLQQRGPAAPARQLYLSLADQELTALVLGSRLEFCNVFAVSTPEDVVYFTILVMQQLGLSPDQDPVTIWGELTGDSAVFTLLSTYVRHLRLGARPFGLHYTYRLNDVPAHRHFDLFSLALAD